MSLYIHSPPNNLISITTSPPGPGINPNGELPAFRPVPNLPGPETLKITLPVLVIVPALLDLLQGKAVHFTSRRTSNNGYLRNPWL
ncbi:MAG TPA: hypothetical protein VMW63_03890 [Methanoregulaceae archaeon]|nr:hypothetical protein [Methanoregulaceae archaeon]